MQTDLIAVLNERFAESQQRFRDLDADQRAQDTEIDKMQTDLGVMAEQVAMMVSAFRAARTAFYSLATALSVACVVWLLTGH